MDDQTLDNTEHVGSKLVGGVDQMDGHAYIPAVANIVWTFPGRTDQTLCSGTLVAPNKVLTAAHCLCPRDDVNPNAATVKFGDANGHLLGQSWQAAGWVAAPGAEVCSDFWYQATTDDPIDHSHADVAVVTLAPNASGLPTMTPVAISLDDPGLSFGTNSANHTLLPRFGTAGWGDNFSDQTFSSPDTCVGCNIRRSGELSNNVVLAQNPCSTFPLTPLKDPFPQDCWEGRLWTANGVSKGELLEIGHGDSGGPLMFNLDTGTETVAGVTSSWLPDILGGSPPPFPRHTKWATTGDNAEFLWGALGQPFTFSLAQQRASAVIVTRQTAPSGKQSLYIHDRANVQGGQIVTQSWVMGGVESVFVAGINARGIVSLRDRARTRNIVTSSTLIAGNGVITGTVRQGAFQKFEDFNLANAPAAVVNTSTNVHRGTTTVMLAGDHGNVTVDGGGTLQLTAGTHTFKNLQLESGSTVNVTSGVTRIFIWGSDVIFRGAIMGNAANILIGMPSAGSVTIGNTVNGTIVAPNADVVADMITNATLTGAYFVKSFELHQGRFLFFMPFNGGAPWVP